MCSSRNKDAAHTLALLWYMQHAIAASASRADAATVRHELQEDTGVTYRARVTKLQHEVLRVRSAALRFITR